jgi:hypothetical protein
MFSVPNRRLGERSMTHSAKRRPRGGERRPRALNVTEIHVVDPNGDEVKVIEREHLQRLPFIGLHRKVFSYQLDSGEAVQVIDEDTFLLTHTGEKFARIK